MGHVFTCCCWWCWSPIPDEVPIWAKKGWLLPLENMPASFAEDDLIPAVKNALSYGGKLFASPFYGESSFVMYRKDIILDMPTQPTWGEVYQYAKKYHKRRDRCADPDTCEGTEPDFNGICLRGKAGWGENGAFLTTLANAFGGRWFDESWAPQLMGSEWNAAISFYVDLMRNFGPSGAFNFGFSENLLNFQQGKCLMWIDATVAASWLTESPPWGFKKEDPCFGKTAKELADDDGSLNCTPMWKKIDKCGFVKAPAGQWRKAGWLWSWNIAIPGGSKKLADTRKFVDWATNKNYVELVATATGRRSVPPGTRTSTYTNEEYKKIDFATKTLDAMQLADPTMATGTMKPKPYVGVQFAAIPEFQEIGGIVGRQLSLALEGRKSVADALRSAQASTVVIMRRAGHLKQAATTKSGEGKAATTWGRDIVITKKQISSSLWSTSLAAADIDTDGHTDLVVVGDTTTWIGYFKNLGGGKGFSKSVTPLLGACVAGKEDRCAFGANSAVVVDGNVAFTAVDQGNYKFTVGLIKRGSNEPVILTQNVLLALSKVIAADVDGDGRADLIVCGSSVAWMKNLGDGKFGTLTVIGTSGAVDVEAADVDGDGDIDIVGATTGSAQDTPRWKGVIYLLTNDGTGKFTQSQISARILQASGVASIPRDDGKGINVVSTSSEDSTVALHRWTATSGWTMTKLTHQRCGESDLDINAPDVMDLCAHFASGVVAFDADSDGDLDLAVVSRNDNSVSWFENMGNDTFSHIRRLDTYAKYASGVVALDADGDGSVDDLASASEFSINWYLNDRYYTIQEAEKTVAPDLSKFRMRERAAFDLPVLLPNAQEHVIKELPDASTVELFRPSVADGWSCDRAAPVKVGELLALNTTLCAFWHNCRTETTLKFNVHAAGRSASSQGVPGTINFAGSCTTTSLELRGLVNAIASLSIAVAVIVGGWTISKRTHPVLLCSQPAFLLTVVLGNIISTGTLFAFTVDDEGKAPTEVVDGRPRWPHIDVACRAQPWLYWLGFAISFSSLLLKTWRIKEVVTGAKGLRRIKIRASRLFMWMFALCVLISIILGIWLALDPLRWDRDDFAKTGGSTGKCVMDSAWPFILPLLSIQGLCYCYANMLLYQAREVHTYFKESKYITMAMFSSVQVFALSIPVIVIVMDMPDANLLVRALAVFINDFALLALIFFPKMYMVHSQSVASASAQAITAKDEQASVIGTSFTVTKDEETRRASVTPASNDAKFDSEAFGDMIEWISDLQVKPGTAAVKHRDNVVEVLTSRRRAETVS